MNQEQLDKVLRRHALWLDGKPDRARAFLAFARLRKAKLHEARLERAMMYSANLEGADMSAAKLQGAVLTFAKLRKANLIGANLERARLLGADLTGADLGGAKLGGADLGGARLDQAKLPPGYGTLGQLGGRYIVNWSPEKIFIGWEAHSREEWLGFTDHEIAGMGRGALPWWQAQRDEIIAAYDESQTQGA